MSYRARLRPDPTDEELATLYPRPHNHKRWSDHRIRVDVTTAVARWVHQPGDTIADLSCGDADIAKALAFTSAKIFLGDLAPGYELHGPIEETLYQIPNVGTFICSETIEHLKDPDSVLAQIRQRADHLVLSTPIGERDAGNPEHLWGWDTEAVEEMLNAAGWRPFVLNRLELREFIYDFQIWGCR